MTRVRLIYGVFIIIVAAFVTSNVWQVFDVLFIQEPAAEHDPAKSPKVAEPCKGALTEELRAIEAGKPADVNRANASCASDPHGPEAVAALERLDRASKTRAVQTATELRPVRLAAQSFISGAQQ